MARQVVTQLYFRLSNDDDDDGHGGGGVVHSFLLYGFHITQQVVFACTLRKHG